MNIIDIAYILLDQEFDSFEDGVITQIVGYIPIFDFEYELQLSQTNHALYNNIKTVFLITKPEYNFISSSCVREILLNKGDITGFVPKPVSEYLYAIYGGI